MARIKLKQKRPPANAAPEPKGLEVSSDQQVMAGRYANIIQVSVQPEEFILDFIAKAGNRGALAARIFISPKHAQRLRDLLAEQIKIHRAKFRRPRAK